MKTQRDVVGSQKGEGVLVVPGRLAHLDGVPVAPGQGGEKCPQPLAVVEPSGRELVEERPELGGRGRARAPSCGRARPARP
jgi:hypothetical protein